MNAASSPQPPEAVLATVCNYNGRAYLEDCLRALQAQTRPLADIVVYDNASTDDSVAFLRERFPEVRVVEMGGNEGPCPVRNRGLAEADTEWVLQVDSDVILEPDCLEKLLPEARDDVALVMPRAVFDSDRRRIHYDGGSFHYIGVMTLRNFFGPVPATPEQPLDVDAAIAMALLVRREVVRGVGGYHAGYFILFEDHDLSYQLRALGHRIRLVPDALVYHREGTAGISYREGSAYPGRRAFLHSRNRWMLLVRNHSLSALVLGLPGIVLYEAVWFGFALVKGNLGDYVRGKVDFVRQLPALLRQRRVIQARRQVGDRTLLGGAALTHAPMVKSGSWSRRFERGLDWLLGGWWSLARRFVS